jgi:hypothetical protein
MIRGYKGFYSDFTGFGGFKYEVGKTYVHEDSHIELCKSGFHFCIYPVDVLMFYSNHSTRYAIIEASGDILHGNDKSVCSSIKIVEEITREKLFQCMPEYIERVGGTKEWFKNGLRHRDGDLPSIILADGTKEWREGHKLHRKGGLPAIEWANGTKEWWVGGSRHRDDGLPAVECCDGSREWWVKGLRHRDGGLPAIKWASGTKEWWVNDKRHRDGGLPAIECDDGYKEWWVKGIRVK